MANVEWRTSGLKSNPRLERWRRQSRRINDIHHALEVNRIIKENCGINRWVTPLVVFVGNCTIKKSWGNTDARVFTADQVARYIHEQQPELMRREIDLICSHLERSVKR
jgi:hypothetical protein